MADLKITGLTSIAAAAAREDLLHVIDDPTGTPANKKVTIGEMMNALHAPVKLSAGTQSLTEAAHAGRMLIVPDQAANSILTLPTPKIGMSFNFTYGGVADDASNNSDGRNAEGDTLITDAYVVETALNDAATFTESGSTSGSANILKGIDVAAA